jgi:hypothetical protein
MGLAVENGHRFARTSPDRELKELDEMAGIEGAVGTEKHSMNATFAEPERDTIFQDENGKTHVEAVGAGTFKAATRRHLFLALDKTENFLRYGFGDEAEADEYAAHMVKAFQGVPQFELFQLHNHEFSPDKIDSSNFVKDLRRRKVHWPIWSVSFASGQIGATPIGKSFYPAAVPFGTVYQAECRMYAIQEVGVKQLPAIDLAVYKKLAELPPQQANLAMEAIMAGRREEQKAYEVKALTVFETALRKLAPGQYALAVSRVSPDKLLDAVQPFLAYNIRPFEMLKQLDATKLDDAHREQVMRQHAELEPFEYFRLAEWLRIRGRDDEAADLDRKGIALAQDQVGVSNSVGDLVVYDMAHGKQDEAMQVAKNAADVGSGSGMETYMLLLAQLNRPDEAEKVGQEILSRYGSEEDVMHVYMRFPDHFPDDYKALLAKYFPEGLQQVTLASFSEPAHRGVLIPETNPLVEKVGLHKGDVIVALDGYKVDSVTQYFMIRYKTDDPAMDFIVWRDTGYIEVKASLLGRRIHVMFRDFVAH